MRNKTTAALFAILGGSLGLQKFYLGQIGWGITYAVFFWTGIPSVIGIIEGMMLLSMDFDKFDSIHNSKE